MAKAAGIDLGTTFSAIAHIDDSGVARVIPNDLGEKLTPSVIALADTPPLVGADAKARQQDGDDSVYAFFKRDMGSRHALYIEAGREFSPVDLSAMVLEYLKRCADDYLGTAVTHAVITVPAYFNNQQRQETIRAGEQAGLDVLRIISEPTAAALAYGLRPGEDDGVVLVYDLGGGTFDVSLVKLSEDNLHVIATAGDHELGGKDWDDRILQYLVTQFEDETGFEIPMEEYNALLVKAENIKKSLSVRQQARERLHLGGHTRQYEITREQFESMTRDLLNRTKMIADETLQDAGYTWGDLAGTVLVGGSTRMPMIHDYVEEMSGKKPLRGVDPDEAVALGAAMQAQMDMNNRQSTSSLVIGGRQTHDVISNSLGMIAENADRSAYINSIIIEKNQPIPCEQTRPYRLRVGKDQTLEVYMTQGESTDPQTCYYLGRYVFSDIPQTSKRQAIIDITYAYDLNGVVQVEAVERESGSPLTLSVEPVPADVPQRFAMAPTDYDVREHLNLFMAFDLSGSMSGHPLREAQKAAHGFLEQIDLTSASVGIIEFSDRTQTAVTLEQNARRITRGIDNLSTGRTGYGNATHPFDEIYKHLHNREGLRYALVLADGVWSDQPKAVKQARRCHEAGIEIIAVGFGSADEQFLRDISSSEEYSFFTDLNKLTTVFSSIAQELTESESGLSPEGMRDKRRGLSFF